MCPALDPPHSHQSGFDLTTFWWKKAIMAKHIIEKWVGGLPTWTLSALPVNIERAITASLSSFPDQADRPAKYIENPTTIPVPEVYMG